MTRTTAATTTTTAAAAAGTTMTGSGETRIRIEYDFTFRFVRFVFLFLFSAKYFSRAFRWMSEWVYVCACVRFWETIIGLAFLCLMFCYGCYCVLSVRMISQPNASHSYPPKKSTKSVSHKCRTMSRDFSARASRIHNAIQILIGISFKIPNDIRLCEYKNTRFVPNVPLRHITTLHFTFFCFFRVEKRIIKMPRH